MFYAMHSNGFAGEASADPSALRISMRSRRAAREAERHRHAMEAHVQREAEPRRSASLRPALGRTRRVSLSRVREA